MSSDKVVMDEQQMATFFKSFELSTEFRNIMLSDKPLYHHLPKLIKGVIEYQFLSYYFSDVPNWRLAARKMLSKDRIAPNYVMTGPGKSGSSDLVSHLLFHPNVIPPLAKEPKMHLLSQNKNWRAGFPTVKEVQKLQESVAGPVRCGYLDPELHNLYVMDTLHQLNPDCKIIVTLRDPVDRAYSYWKWEVFVGGSRLKNSRKAKYFEHFSDYVARALDLFPSIPMDTVAGLPVLESGIYYKAVELWIERFGQDNVMVLDVADYFQARQPVLDKIQRFLDLPVMEIPQYSKKANENPIKLPPPDAQSTAALAAFYQPYNQRLFDLLGTKFNWQ